MAYTTIDQANVLLPNRLQITGTSNPTATQMDVVRTQIEADVNVALKAGGLTSPATDAQEVLAIALLCATELARRFVVKAEGLNEPTEKTDYQKTLELMRAGQWSGASGSSGPSAPSATTDIDPWFTRAKEY